MASKRILTFLLFCAFAVLSFPFPLQCQTGHHHQVPSADTDPGAPPESADQARERVMREMAKKANLERQAALRIDTDKLLKLATDLKVYVEKSNENVLSVDVVRKAEEIEKLAKRVKDKMKGPN